MPRGSATSLTELYLHPPPVPPAILCPNLPKALTQLEPYCRNSLPLPSSTVASHQPGCSGKRRALAPGNTPNRMAGLMAGAVAIRRSERLVGDMFRFWQRDSRALEHVRKVHKWPQLLAVLTSAKSRQGSALSRPAGLDEERLCASPRPHLEGRVLRA